MFIPSEPHGWVTLNAQRKQLMMEKIRRFCYTNSFFSFSLIRFQITFFSPAPTCKRFHFFFIPVQVELVDRHCPTSLIIIYSRGKLVTVAKQRLDWGRGLRQTKCWLNLSLRTAWCLILTLTLTLTLDLWSLLFGRSWTESIPAA